MWWYLPCQSPEVCVSTLMALLIACVGAAKKGLGNRGGAGNVLPCVCVMSAVQI